MPHSDPLPAAAAPTRSERDLASDELWALSLERSRRRRALAAERHRRAPGASKGTAAAVSAALLVSPGLALAATSSPRSPAARSSAPQTPKPRHDDGSIVRRGDVNGTVAKAQRALGVAADRIFGPLTQRAVKDFQARAKLPRTGRIDARTWVALFGSPIAGGGAGVAAPVAPPTPAGGAPAAPAPPAAAEPTPGTPAGKASPTEPTPTPPAAAPRGSCGGAIFTPPLRGKTASGFGDGRNHAGVDISAPVGTSVRAAACGTVTLAGVQSGYGKIICIRHTTAFSTCYAHLSSFAVARGTQVAVGQLIGRVGMTGRTSGAHLHFETRVDGRPRDPNPYLDGSRTIPGAAARITTG